MEGWERRKQSSKFLTAIARDIFSRKNYPTQKELHNVIVAIYASFPFFRTEKSDVSRSFFVYVNILLNRIFLAESIRCKIKPGFQWEDKNKGFR